MEINHNVKKFMSFSIFYCLYVYYWLQGFAEATRKVDEKKTEIEDLAKSLLSDEMTYEKAPVKIDLFSAFYLPLKIGLIIVLICLGYLSLFLILKLILIYPKSQSSLSKMSTWYLLLKYYHKPALFSLVFSSITTKFTLQFYKTYVISVKDYFNVNRLKGHIVVMFGSSMILFIVISILSFLRLS